MKYSLDLDKRSMQDRYLINLFSKILLLAFLLWYIYYKTGFNFDMENSIVCIPIAVMYFVLVSIGIKWNKIYVYELNCNEEIITIKYLSFNEEKELTFNKKEVKILLERVPVQDLVPHFKLIFKRDDLSLSQYSGGVFDSNTEWTRAKMKEVFDSLIKWQKD